jgi:hypothetical protein
MSTAQVRQGTQYAPSRYGSRGPTRLDVHRYDQDWQDTEEPFAEYSNLWFEHTTETFFHRPDPGMEVYDRSTNVPLLGGNNYLIWAALQMSGNGSFFSGAGGSFRAQCVDIWVNP